MEGTLAGPVRSHERAARCVIQNEVWPHVLSAMTHAESARERRRAPHRPAVAPGQPLVGQVGYRSWSLWVNPGSNGIGTYEADYLAGFIGRRDWAGRVQIPQRQGTASRTAGPVSLRPGDLAARGWPLARSRGSGA